MPFTHQERKPGDLIRSDDWNQMGSEVERLDRAKVNRDGGDVINGPLGLRGDVTVGLANRGASLRIFKAQEPATDLASQGAVILGTDAPTSASLRLGYDATFSWLQGVGQQTLSLNPRGGPVGVGTAAPRSTLSVAGSLSVGAGFASSTAAPVNSVLVEGSVGIGTATPASRLAVSGGATVGAGYATSAAPTNGLLVQGRLGIGVVAPENMLDVGGDVTLGATRGSRFVLHTRPLNGGDYLHLTADNAAGAWDWNGGLVLRRAGGAVGIGTAVPGSRLAVSGGATVGAGYAATAAPANGLLVEGSLGIGTNAPRSALDTGKGVMTGAANDYEKAQFALSGGGTVTWAGPGGRLKWSARFIAISMEKGRSFFYGHLDILQPTADIPAAFVHDGLARSATAEGVVLHAWEALYAVHNVGGANTDLTFRVVKYDQKAEFSAPSNWILVAVVNHDDRTVKLGTGQVLVPGTHTAGVLPRLDTAEHGAAYIRAFDLFMGHSTRRGTPGRALVDENTVLTINYGSDWTSGTRVSGALEVTGELRIGSDKLHALGGAESVRTLRGVVNSTGGIEAGSGFTVTRVGVGLFDVRFTTFFSARPAGVVTQIFPSVNDFGTGANVLDNAVIVGIDTTRVRIKTGDASGGASDRSFSFIVIGPR